MTPTAGSEVECSCGKWVIESEAVLVFDFKDGLMSVCPECAKKYGRVEVVDDSSH